MINIYCQYLVCSTSIIEKYAKNCIFFCLKNETVLEEYFRRIDVYTLEYNNWIF